MKYLLLLTLIMALLTPSYAFLPLSKKHPQYEELKPGDIVFQDTRGAQGEAVRAATNSPYTHCGIVFRQNKQLYVLEAVEPVRVIPLKTWKNSSKIFHARRLKDPKNITPTTLKKAENWGKQQIAKHYDLKFQWGDDELYCSELVWKIYKKAFGIRLCEPKTFHSYFLEKPSVRAIIIKRYGSLENFSKDEPVVAPSDLADSPLLEEIPRIVKKHK